MRSKEKGEALLAAHPQVVQGQLAYTIVKDIVANDAFNDAVRIKEFDAILHVASPFHYNPKDAKKDLIDPAVNGTLGILNAAKLNAPSVKRIIITSSFSAVINLKNPEVLYNEHHFNPITAEEAYEDGVQAYRASKTFAERAAWEFVQSQNPHFSITTMCPPLILGPPTPWLQSVDSINTSNERLVGLLQGKWRQKLPPTASWYWVDVRDVALAHVRAMEKPQAANRRFLLMQGTMSNAEIARVAVAEFPALAGKVPQRLDSDKPSDLFKVDTTPSVEILGIEYRGLDKCIVDTIYSLNVSVTA